MKIHVVLVRSEYAANVGAAARAMANMGGDRLILIDPQCRIGNRAKEMAAGAQEKLSARTLYKTWEQFYAHEGEGVRLALTRRGGRKRKIFSLTEKLEEFKAKPKREWPNTIYLIFGPEADGLNAEDLAWVNFAAYLPIFGDFGSLNLGQAVLLGSYLARSVFPPAERPAQVKGSVPEIAQPFYFPDQLIKDWLTAMGFNVQARKASAYLTLRRLFLQNQPTHSELHVLESILQQNIRKLRSLGLAAKNVTHDFGDVPVE